RGSTAVAILRPLTFRVILTAPGPMAGTAGSGCAADRPGSASAARPLAAVAAAATPHPFRKRRPDIPPGSLVSFMECILPCRKVLPKAGAILRGDFGQYKKFVDGKSALECGENRRF